MKYHLIALILLLPDVGTGQPRELRPIFEVAGTDSGAMLGSTVKGIGDLNHDGYTDVAVSAQGLRKTFVYYGGNPMSTTPALTFEGGGAITSGDFNGDGWIDLAIQRYFRDTVFIYYGGAMMDTIPDRVLVGEHTGDSFGFALASGDLNGDGYDELIITARQFSSQTNDPDFFKGKIYVYAGGSYLDSIPRITFQGDTTRAGLGHDLAISDVNADGMKDILALGYNQVSSIGQEQFYYFSIYLGVQNFQMSRNYYVDSRTIARGFKHEIAAFDADGDSIADILVNRIFVFKGGQTIGLQPTYYVPPPNNDTTLFGPYPRASGGGDYNRDGVKDVLLRGTVGMSPPGVFVMLGRPNSPGHYVAYRVFSQCCGQVGLVGRPDNAGDVNGDGVDDIIMGSPNEPSLYVRGFFGIYSGDTTLVVSVKDEQQPLPEDSNLGQNYPNPFNPSTTVEYTLSKETVVSILIFDNSGRRVVSLVNERQAAGKHTIQWDGRDAQGIRLASGVYYYQLRTSEFVQTKRLIHLK